MPTTCQRLTSGWEFRRSEPGSTWEFVCLPHNPFVADLDGREHWHGRCEYRRRLRVEGPEVGFAYVLHLGAAMRRARLFIEGHLVAEHAGGYLPFEVDLTDYLGEGRERELRVTLDNGDDPDVPPGKPFRELDFCCYGGLYRHVELRAYPSLRITDPVAANAVASGGIFVRTISACEVEASLSVRVHVSNAGTKNCDVGIAYRIYDDAGSEVTRGASDSLHLGPSESFSHDFEISLANPLLWCVETPFLHRIEVELIGADGSLIDKAQERFGVRQLCVSRSEGIVLNGKRIRPRGVNRHQDYPRVGYALSDAAQHRDAKRIKESGFDYVRLSHYPQSPAFLDACDELGILVMNCIPGWQYMGGEAFRQACYRNARELIRRDRNHPCVILWELSLNETEMDEVFMDTLMRIGHEEFPGEQMYVCGWVDRFDVFIHSRQHGRIHSWQNGDKALVVAEYGDWEFYAANEGFDQKTGAGLLDDSSNSRALRGAGEGRLRQQARNHIEALNDTLGSSAVCDGLWSMYDYPRGYHPTRAACGVMDFHRLPKYSYFFYRSQRAPQEGGPGWSGGPMVYIASRWIPDSQLDILVFSNCERVELRLNDSLAGANRGRLSDAFPNLPYAPFVFEMERFEPGRLEAVGYCDDAAVAVHSVATPAEPRAILLTIEDAGRSEALDAMDVLLAHARIVDSAGAICKQSSKDIDFSIEGGADLVGPTRVAAESGVASVVVRRLPGCSEFTLLARSDGLGETGCVYYVEKENSAAKQLGS